MQPGDHIVVGSAHAGETQRTAEILEVKESEGRVHYRVRWSDGRESVFFPAAGTMIRVKSAQGTDTAVMVRH